MIIQIVPKIRPQLDGVGEFAYLLAEDLKKSYGQNSKFIVADSTQTVPQDDNEFPRVIIKDRLVSETIRTLTDLSGEDSAFILHYVGYGYSKKGVPFWLEKGIRGWKAEFPNCKLITFFHEIAANSKPWKSPFWLRLFQENIAAKLALVSDSCITSNSLNADYLLKLAPEIKDKICVMPVYSTIGESTDFKPNTDRADKLVIFGTPGRRIEVYRRQKLLEKLVSDLKITEIFDIGPEKLDIPSCILSAKVNIKGILNPQQLKEILLKSKYGVVDCPVAVLGRSTIFAAYCGYGLVPIVTGTETSDKKVDGLTPDVNILIPHEARELPSPEKLSEIAKSGFEWYQGHNLAKHSGKYIELLGNQL